jgi:hypothetical protein
MKLGNGRCGGAGRGVLSVLLLLGAVRVAAEDLRVLLVMPGGTGKLARQVSRLNAALARSNGPLVRGQGLLDSDVVVAFTSYRRILGPEGGVQDWWEGHLKPLKRALSRADLQSEAPELIGFIVMDHESWEMEPVLRCLEMSVKAALGRDAPRKPSPFEF